MVSETETEYEKDGSSYINKSLDKALEILNLFDMEATKMSVTEISQKYGTSPSSLYPIIRTLEKHDYLERDSDKLYSLGLAFVKKSKIVLNELNILTEARPELENLRTKTEKTVHLGYLNETEVVYVEKVESKGGIRMYSSPGKTAPVYATALGKAILAFISEKRRDRILSDLTLSSKTRNTITSEEKFKTELHKINEKGYALDDEEFEEGIRCVASPVFRHDGRVEAAVSVTGLAAQLKGKKLKEIIPLIKKSTKKISANLGHDTRKNRETK